MGLRLHIYKIGLRPSPGCVLYSPSLHLIYSMADSDLAGAMRAGLESGPELPPTVHETVQNSNQENKDNG